MPSEDVVVVCPWCRSPKLTGVKGTRRDNDPTTSLAAICGDCGKYAWVEANYSNIFGFICGINVKVDKITDESYINRVKANEAEHPDVEERLDHLFRDGRIHRYKIKVKGIVRLD